MMDERWRNLGLVFAFIFVVFIVWVLVFSFSAPASSLQSFEAGHAMLQAKLLASIAFDSTANSLKTEDAVNLRELKETLSIFKNELETGPGFSGQNALIALTDYWISYADLGLAWNEMQVWNEQILFSGQEPAAVICAQKTFLVSLKEKVVRTHELVTTTLQKRSDFVLRFPIHAVQAGFAVGLASALEEDEAGLNSEALVLEEVLAGCP